jgi:membrane protein implicated in regulation of membrane protease activity
MYIDPSTGGVLFQALAGVFVALSGVLLVFSRKIREGIAKRRRKNRQDEEETNNE